MTPSSFKYIVVGAGLWGGVIAESIASRLGERVLVVERRSHTGGNCHSAADPDTGIECHTHGSHIFHTAIPEVWEYINRFATFTNYRHKVLIERSGRVYPMPISLATINTFYGKNLKPHEAEAFIRAEAARDFQGEPQNLEEKAVSLIGRPLYEAFIKGYTTKQWARDPRKLPAAIITRLPVRTNYDTGYFNDAWQGMPADGYAALFQKLFDNPLIEVMLDTDFIDIADQVSAEFPVFYSGPLDALFRYAHGPLEWRSLRFEREIVPHADFQGTAVMNQGDADVPYTRIHEFKHLHPERGPQGDRSVIVREYPKTFSPGDEAYYPVNTPENERILRAYRDELRARKNIFPGGRLGAYAYMDMDKTIASALACFEDVCINRSMRYGRPENDR